MTEINDQESLSKWVREQFQRANKHLAEKGILFESVVTEESRYLAPYAAVWRIRSQDKKSFWVISGDVPADAVPVEAAETAREAMKRFSYSWRMQAENIRRSNTLDKDQQAFATLLDNKADMLYAIASDKKVWQD
ncbi:DUF4826 family protein [Glaciecola siphonariae]|uniref:DUF4826 family protein n=1 Tax=Glaciecola siphonariae TaxID=521012 RepID=A0ABV9LUN5_9ALTE